MPNKTQSKNFKYGAVKRKKIFNGFIHSKRVKNDSRDPTAITIDDANQDINNDKNYPTHNFREKMESNMSDELSNKQGVLCFDKNIHNHAKTSDDEKIEGVTCDVFGNEQGVLCVDKDIDNDAIMIITDKQIEYLDHIIKQLADRKTIEEETRQQADCALWHELRRSLVTASNFGKICKRRNNICSAALVKSMLYSYSLDHVPAILHGKTNEATALLQLAKQENILINKCGLFVDEEYFFLGATPDGTYENGIVEIKCPITAVGISADEGIRSKKIKIWKVDKEGNIKLNTAHNWYYQVQGQLHITKKEICLFAVWTGPDFPLKTVIIKKDDHFWDTKIKNRLKDFYFKCMLPEIIDPRKCRSMALRTCTY